MNFLIKIFIVTISLGTFSCKKKDNTYKLVNTLKIEATNMARLVSDGHDTGKDAYALILENFGENSIETPDLFDDDHIKVKHIYEDSDSVVGNHFVFTMHLNEDGNCGDCGSNSNSVQRNEIKIHRKSPDRLKGFKDETYIYKWKFKIDDGFHVSERFTNFFQLKPINRDFISPILKLAASKRKQGDFLEVRYKEDPIDGKFVTLEKKLLDGNIGEWFELTCQATFSEANAGGKLSFRMTSLEDGQDLFSIKKDSINMWSGGKTTSMRPKWGIVRSMKDKDNLRSEEERIRIADIEIYKHEYYTSQ